MRSSLGILLATGVIVFCALRPWLNYRAPSAMKLSHWAILIFGVSGICALRLWVYYKMAHGEFTELRYLYTYTDKSQPGFGFSNYIDSLAPLLITAIFNGLIGFRDRSFSGVVVMSAALAVVQAAVHPIYQALWGAPPFGTVWQYESHLFTAITTFPPMFILSGGLWAMCRSRAHLSTWPIER